ncbi:hypothetical protein C8J56DRAFT_889047 [Mycena floridula]|nr:hypothetical protein C8J56DRAFT_889047 [Mycena floridula]
MFSFAVLPFLLALPVLGAPRPRASCDLIGVTVPIPAGSSLAAPASAVKFVGLGVGIQNYTCAGTGTYTSTGAVAELADISCLVNDSTLPDTATAAWSTSSKTAGQFITSFPALKRASILGEHYFVVNPVTGSGISPKWDFTSASFAGNSQAFVVAAKTGNVAAPTGSQDVDWLSLSAVSGQGELASQIYRTDTRLGQPPSSCTVGSADISVKYVSKYYLLGGTIA